MKRVRKKKKKKTPSAEKLVSVLFQLRGVSLVDAAPGLYTVVERYGLIQTTRATTI